MEPDANPERRMRVYLSPLARAEWAMPGIQQTESDGSQLIAMPEVTQRWQELTGELVEDDAQLGSAASASSWPPREQQTRRGSCPGDIAAVAAVADRLLNAIRGDS
jgi:hypothetical protein